MVTENESITASLCVWKQKEKDREIRDMRWYNSERRGNRPSALREVCDRKRKQRESRGEKKNSERRHSTCHHSSHKHIFARLVVYTEQIAPALDSADGRMIQRRHDDDGELCVKHMREKLEVVTVQHEKRKKMMT